MKRVHFSRLCGRTASDVNMAASFLLQERIASPRRKSIRGLTPLPPIVDCRFQPMRPFKAIAAMSQNRVIGRAGAIPWRLPEDFKWFKKITTGHVLVMGRKTFESIGRPLPERTTLVLSRGGFSQPGARRIADLSQLARLEPELAGKEIFICGGAQVYAQALPHCSDLYLTLVKREVEGDTFFPPFEDQFTLAATITETDDFSILHYQRAV